MKCPYCGLDNTRVVDSRPADDNSMIRRRRQCDECGKRFTTFERAERNTMLVIKKDQSREKYSREKISDGVMRACHKRKVSVQQMNDLINQVETEIFNREEKEIKSSEIGEMVMVRLKDLDEVAYVRFASVYRQFKDIHTFMEELTKLLGDKSREN